MAQTSMNIRIDEDVKKEFDAFCLKVGINPSVAVNMFARAVIRERRIPFEITDEAFPRITSREALGKAFKAAQDQSVLNGTDTLTMDEINAEIGSHRQEKRAQP